MKLRNVLFSAAFIFSAGIGFVVAEDPADEDTLRETTYAEPGRTAAAGGTSFEQYSGSSAGTVTAIIARPKTGGTAEAEKGRTSISGEGFSEAEAAALSADQPVDRLPVYDLAVPFDAFDLDGIGFLGKSDGEKPLDAPVGSAEPSSLSLLPESGPYSFLVFEKNAFTSSKNSPQIMSERSQSDKLKDEDEFARPEYSTPLALLIVTIVLCLLLVLFTSTGLNLND